MVKLRTLKELSKKAEKEDELSFGGYTIDYLRIEAVKWYKEIVKCQKDDCKSLPLGELNVCCINENVPIDEDGCFLIKEWLKHFFGLSEEDLK